MYYAVHQNKTETAKRLIQHGADVDDALKYARQHGRIELAEWLSIEKTKKSRARRHWALMRDIFRVRPYALFWFTYVGTKMCAPGGKWEANDRVNFEEDFGEKNVHQ
jgi:hypothetical protein